MRNLSWNVKRTHCIGMGSLVQDPVLLSDWDENSLRNPEELLTLWREQRSFRIGKRLCYAGIFLALGAIAVDLIWSPLMVVAGDFVLLVGCLLALLGTKSKPRPRFNWVPLYAGFWISILPSLWSTGGLGSPFLGVDLALLLISAVIIQSRLPWFLFSFFALMHLPALYLLEYLIPPLKEPPQSGLILTVLALSLGAIVICVYELLRAESEISQAFADRYRMLSQTRKELQKEEASNAAKTAFLANVSHELRTPLTSILGYSDMLMNSPVAGADRFQFLQTIHRNGQQLAMLVDDLLDLSKVEIGKIEIQKEPLSIMDLISEVVQQSNLQARRKQLTIEIQQVGPVPARISSDALRVKQILLNIVGNAVKFTDYGFVRIEIGEQTQSWGESLRIAVRDSGRGMSVSEQEFLFKPFSQIDPSLSRRYGGTGLGLHLSRKLARLLGGDLTLEQSLPGQGSVFVLSLPCEKVEQTEIPRERSPMKRALSGKKILVVDDMPDTQKLMGYLLEEAGAQVVPALDGFEGLKKSLAGDFDMVILDVQMPLMDGYETVRGMRRQGIKVPVLALTAHALPEERERCIQAGCNSYLSKPVNRQALIQEIQNLLSPQSAVMAPLF